MNTLSPLTPHFAPTLRRLVLSLALGFALFAFTAIVSASPIFAATRYVNSDSNGAAANPTRAFDHPSYSVNDSYKTLAAAFSAAAHGDIIELSGGTSSKVYPGVTYTLQKSITIQGSTTPNHDGEVIIDRNPSGGNVTLVANANNMTLSRLTISRNGGTSGDFALKISKNNITLRDVKVANASGFGISVDTTANGTLFENFRVDTATIKGPNAMNAYRGFTMRNSIFSGLDPTGIAGISFQANSGVSNLENVVFDGTASGAIMVTTGSTVNLTNCVITGQGFNFGRSIHFNSAGTVNTTNCFLQGPLRAPHRIVSGTGTWNSTNDIINEFSHFNRTSENFGYIMLEIDDRHNLGHFKTIADYAMATYSMPLAIYIHDTENLSATDKISMQQLYLDGHEIALHGRHHTNMGVVGPWKVTYSGASTNNALIVSGAGTSLSVTGNSDAQAPIDLTSESADTLGEACAVIHSWANYTCVLTGDPTKPTKEQVPSYVLKDATTSLPRTVATIIPYDDRNTADNRYLTEEVTRGISDLEAAMDENPLTADFKVNSFGYPYSQRTDLTTAWMVEHTELTSVRAVSTDSLQEKSWLGNIDIHAFHNSYNAIDLEGPGYESLSIEEKESRIKQAARAMVTAANMGVATGFIGHNESQDFSVGEWIWLIDELAIYAPLANVKVTTEEKAIAEITTSGLWIDQGNGFWTRTFTGEADYSPTSQSLMIDAGVAIPGRTTDILGNPIVGNPDIGAFEYQGTQIPDPEPTVPPTTTVSGIDADWHSSDVTATLTCIPAAESECAATYYTIDGNTPTTESATGTSVVFSTDGVFTLKFFSVDDHGNAESVQTAPVQVKIDKTAPTAPGIAVNASPADDLTPTWSWTVSTDTGSGLAESTYAVEWSQAADFTTGVSSASTSTNSFTHPVDLSDGTWYFRVKASDAIGNESSFSTGETAIVILAPVLSAPTVPVYIEPVNGAINQKLDAALNWSASTDPDGGAVTYDIYFGENPASLSLVLADKVGFYYSPALQDSKTYYWQLVAKDSQGETTAGPISSFSTYQRIATPENLAKNKPISSSNRIASGIPSYINDGMKFSDGARAFDTMEAVRTNSLTGQVTIDLGESYTINSVVLQVEDDDSYKVQTSANGTSWTTFGNSTPKLNNTTQTTYQSHTITQNRAGVRYVRVVPVSGNYVFRMSEIEVYQ